jgi:protein NRD1
MSTLARLPVSQLANDNQQSSTVIIQKLFTHFKKAPGPYKLGVLYVVDSVLRQWIDGAKKSGQPLGAGAADGTFAAGVYRITELIDVFVNDTIATAPDDQRDKIMRLFDIWERGNTFPASKRSKWKEQLAAPPKSMSPIAYRGVFVLTMSRHDTDRIATTWLHTPRYG